MVTGIMFHWGRNKRDLQEIISKASNFKERAKFPSRIKTIVSRKFQRWQTQFQSKRLVMLQTDVYVAADRYQAKWLDKRRILWRYKLNMLLLVHENCLFAYGVGIWNFTWGNEAWYRFPWRNIHFIIRICLVSSIQLLARIANIHVTMPCCVTAFVFCPARLDPRLDSQKLVFDSRFSIRVGIENRELSQESRLATDCQLTFERYCIVAGDCQIWFSGKTCRAICC